MSFLSERVPRHLETLQTAHSLALLLEEQGLLEQVPYFRAGLPQGSLMNHPYMPRKGCLKMANISWVWLGVLVMWLLVFKICNGELWWCVMCNAKPGYVDLFKVTINVTFLKLSVPRSFFP